MDFRDKSKIFQILSTEVMWVSIVNSERKTGTGEYLGQNMSYLSKGLKNSLDLNSIRNRILFLSINGRQHCKLSENDQLNGDDILPTVEHIVLQMTP